MQDEGSPKVKIILISLLLAFSGWVIKAILDSLILYDKPFVEIFITDLSSSEIYIRIFVSLCFFVFGVILSNNYILQRKAEQELKKAHDTLTQVNKDNEKIIQQRTKEINKLLEEKNQLIMNLGHDLRTPLTPLMGLLPSIIKREKDPELKKLLNVSLVNIHHLRDLVSKTIEIARYEADLTELTIEDTNLLSEIDKVIDNNQYIIKDHDIFIENLIDGKINVKADRLRLREVFQNIINNAVKYIKDDRLITIDSEEDDDFFIIRVEDNGKGLTDDQVEHIFDELYKTDSSRHDLTSKGLGLSISKRIVEKHGGRIWAESIGSGKGTKIFFTLPKKIK